MMLQPGHAYVLTTNAVLTHCVRKEQYRSEGKSEEQQNQKIWLYRANSNIYSKYT